MLDMLERELKVNDNVVYVYPNVSGKTTTLKGTIQGFNKKGCILQTKNGNINVKNVILLNRKQSLINKLDSFLNLFLFELRNLFS